MNIESKIITDFEGRYSLFITIDEDVTDFEGRYSLFITIDEDVTGSGGQDLLIA